MCKVTLQSQRQPLVMLREKSYETASGGPPSVASCFFTGMLMVLFLVASEMALRSFFLNIKDIHPILDDEINRLILARHIGVDTLSCLIASILGFKSRHLLSGMVQATVGGKNSMPAAGYESRMFTYHPAAFRICLFFFSYQVKNLFDTIAWNDGPEYVFHHVASLIVAYGGMSAGVGHIYAVFFFGLSEISTAVLCVLANFDDQHGVEGMGDAFPTAKVAIGGLFVVLFLLVRTMAWPIASYFFFRDARLALKQDSPKLMGRKGWIRLIAACLVGVSVLQVAWLGQIFFIAKKEMAAIGLI